MPAVHESGPAETIIEHAVLRPVGDAPAAEALAIGDGRILARGSRAQIGRLRGPETAVIDAGGRTVLPGLVDGHAHLDREGLRAALPSMAGLDSIAAITARIGELVRDLEPGRWLVTMPLGTPPYYRGLPGRIAEGRYPDRGDLDAVSPDNPVYIRPVWGYWSHELPIVSVANSAALRAAGIDRDTVPPSPSIEIVRDASGVPTGVFLEHGPVPTVELTLLAAAPRFDAEDRLAGLHRSMTAYARTGTTAAFEAHGVAEEVAAAYRAVHGGGAPVLRSELMLSPAWPDGADDRAGLLAAGWADAWAGAGSGDGMLRFRGMFLEPHRSPDERLRAAAAGGYTGWAGFSHDAGVDAGQAQAALLAAARRGLRIAVMGTELLDAIESVARRAPVRGLRWVIGHVSTLSARQIAQIARLGMVVTTHTNRYLFKQSEAIAAEIGADRESELVPLRSLLEAGVPVALGTDNVPVSLWNPIWHAVARRGMQTGRVVGAEQRLGLEAALRMAAEGGAVLMGRERSAGRLLPGFDADLMIADRDPFAIDVDELPGVTSLLTLVGGRAVHADPRLLDSGAA